MQVVPAAEASGATRWNARRLVEPMFWPVVPETPPGTWEITFEFAADE